MSDPNSPVVVARVESSAEATAIRTALEAEGITTFATGTHTSMFQAEAPGRVEVVVRNSQASQARDILRRCGSKGIIEPRKG